MKERKCTIEMDMATSFQSRSAKKMIFFYNFDFLKMMIGPHDAVKFSFFLGNSIEILGTEKRRSIFPRFPRQKIPFCELYFPPLHHPLHLHYPFLASVYSFTFFSSSEHLSLDMTLGLDWAVRRGRRLSSL